MIPTEPIGSVPRPSRLISAIAGAGPRDRAALAAVDGMRRWRVEVFGDELLDIVAALR